MRKRSPRIGDKVTCKVERSAYYSGYYGLPVMMFKPGMIGTVTVIAPKVHKVSGSGYDGKGDFLVVGYLDPETGTEQRVGLDFINAVIVP